MSASAAASAATPSSCSVLEDAGYDASYVDWSSGTPVAARDIPPHTLVLKESPCAAVATVAVTEADDMRKKFFPENTRFFPIERDSGTWNPVIELTGAMIEAGYVDHDVEDTFVLSPVTGEGITTVGRAVILNERPMICAWTGLQYGLAIGVRLSKFAHACRPNCTTLFGPEGMAFVATGVGAVPAGTPLTLSMIAHMSGNMLCTCYCSPLVERRTGVSCICDHCKGRRNCASRSASCDLTKLMELKSRNNVDAVTLFGSTDFLAAAMNTRGHLKTLTEMWSRNAEWIISYPYALERLSLKMAAGGFDDGGNPNTLSMFYGVAHAIEELAGGTAHLPPAVPANYLMFMSCQSEFVTLQSKAAPRFAILNAWHADVKKTHAWMGDDDIIEFAVYPAMRMPEIIDIARLLWASRDMPLEEMEATGQVPATESGFRFMTGGSLMKMAEKYGVSDAAVLARVLDNDPDACAAVAIAIEKRLSLIGKDKKKTTTPSGPQCAVCGTETRRRCTRCRLVHFCSVKCLRKGWKEHDRTSCRPRLLKPGDADSVAAMDKLGLPYCAHVGCSVVDRSKLGACSKCHGAFYCSDEHATGHWTVHKEVCTKTDLA